MTVSPWVSTHPNKSPLPPCFATKALSGVRVVIADRSSTTARTLAAMLGEAGCSVRICHNGEQALTAIACFSPDVCVLDVEMPKIGGNSIAASISGTRSQRRPFLVALADWWCERDVHVAIASGFNVYLPRGIDPRSLVEIVDDWHSRETDRSAETSAVPLAAS